MQLRTRLSLIHIYMVQYLEIMMTISSVLAIKSGTDENLEKKKELWQYLKKQNLPLYLRLRTGFLGQGCNLPGKGGRKLLIAGYKICLLYTSYIKNVASSEIYSTWPRATITANVLAIMSFTLNRVYTCLLYTSRCV